jgi:hypothetical protein
MKLGSVGEVIANRKFTLIQEGREPAEVEVLMGKPERFPDHNDYYCPYQITGMGRDKVVAIGGVDAFQAIQLALSTIAVELEVMEKESGGKLSWDASENGDLGFPERDSKKE